MRESCSGDGDYAKLAGLAAEEDIREPLLKSISKRLPWLLVLLVLGLVVSSVVGLFEEVVASLTLVVFFQSLILDMAGNVGTQSLAITFCVLMDAHLTVRQKLSLVIKESRVGLCNGLILGGLSFLLIGLYLMLKGETMQLAFAVSACTGIALIVSMLLSSLSGTTVPILFKTLKIDPAVASGPLITTINRPGGRGDVLRPCLAAAHSHPASGVSAPCAPPSSEQLLPIFSSRPAALV